MGLRMKNFSIMRVHWKIRILGGFHTKNIQGELALKGGEGARTASRFKEGGGACLKGVVFLSGGGGGGGGGWYPNARYYLIWCLYG